jgi:DNA-directed RNA polymerase beta subunit
VLDSKKGDNLMAGVKNKITVFVATSRKIEVGDKLVGRHGNK